MLKKSLQGLGALALFAWTGVGIFMWAEVKNHVTVTIEETSSGQADEAALLADRITTLSADLDALTASLEGNFNLVADALGASANASEVRAAVIEERLHQLEAALPQALAARETAGALSLALAQMEAMQRLAESSPAATSDRPPAGLPTSRAAELSPAVELDPEPLELVLEVETAQAPAVETAERAAPGTKTSFLAFHLPSRDFQFSGRQNFEVLGDLSRVGFDAKSTLHDFSGVSNHVSGSFQVDLAQPGKGISGSIKITTNSLDTGLEARDEAMLEHLGSEAHPNIEFVFESFKPSSIDAEGRKLEGQVSGKMTINGTTRTLEMKIKAQVDESRRLIIEGEAPLSRADYKVHVPGKLGMISTGDEVRIWIHLRSRAKAERKE